ncbi:MAG TPA: hypothetical protein GX400_13340 [Chloroflexi bacterium]|nr:hypothetical protein [Chloroflexota bacterium]
MIEIKVWLLPEYGLAAYAPGCVRQQASGRLSGVQGMTAPERLASFVAV